MISPFTRSVPKGQADFGLLIEALKLHPNLILYVDRSASEPDRGDAEIFLTE